MNPPANADRFPDERPPDKRYAQLTFVVLDHAPLLAHPRLASAVFGVVRGAEAIAPGRLWGALVLPEMARVIVGPGDEAALDVFAVALKAQAAQRLLAIIRCADDDTLDAVLRYSPVWGGAIYRVWQPGYHTQPLWSEYRLSNALYALAHSPDEWRWLSGA